MRFEILSSRVNPFSEGNIFSTLLHKSLINIFFSVTLVSSLKISLANTFVKETPSFIIRLILSSIGNFLLMFYFLQIKLICGSLNNLKTLLKNLSATSFFLTFLNILTISSATYTMLFFLEYKITPIFFK